MAIKIKEWLSDFIPKYVLDYIIGTNLIHTGSVLMGGVLACWPDSESREYLLLSRAEPGINVPNSQTLNQKRICC